MRLDAFPLLEDDAKKRGIFDGPNAWIQWKGTDVCMDVYCKCGASGHFDGDFAYYVQCPSCKTIYAVSGNIVLLEVGPEFAALDPKRIEVDDED